MFWHDCFGMEVLVILMIAVFSLLGTNDELGTKWERIDENINGNVYYLDYESIRKRDNGIYFWYLADYLTPTSSGYFSVKIYNLADCYDFRYKHIGFLAYKEPMGMGAADNSQTSSQYTDWQYPAPESIFNKILQEICDAHN